MNGVLDVALRLLVVFVVFLTFPLIVGQTEHKVMAHMQGRLGPMYAGGFHGWAQLVADGVKFAQKEDIVPAGADRRIFQLAPAVALLPYLLVLLAIPIGWFMARRALQPVEAVTRTATEIAGGAMDRRVAVRGQGDELARLAPDLIERGG